MSNYQKLFVGLLVATVVFGIGFVQPAKAQTVGELAQQIAQLQALLAQLQGLQGTPAPTTGVPVPPLSEGSTGPEVEKLQRWLVAQGSLVMPAGGSYGFFGPLTKAALASWQAANGVAPAEGVYGNITYNKILAMGPVTPPPVLPPVLPPAGLPAGCTSTVGFSSTTGVSCSTVITLPAGCTSTAGYSPTTGLSCSTVTTLPAGCTSTTGFSSTTGLPCTTTTPTGVGNGILVTEALSLESSPADGTDVKIGTTATDIVKWKIKASGDDGILKQWGIKSDVRPWLYWSAARLLVGSQVIAEKTGLTSADAQEVTVGSDYRLVFSNLNYNLPKDTDVYVVLQVDAVTDTSRAAASGKIVDQASNSVIVADANDNYTVSDGVTSDRTWDFVAATTGNVVPSINSANPGTRWAKVSNQTTTDNVTLMVFDLKAESKEAEINTIRIGASTSGETTNTLISAWDLYKGSCPTDGSTSGCTMLAGGTWASASGLVTFSNLTVRIPANTKQAFTVKGKFADEDDFTAAMDTAASTTVYANATQIAGADIPTYSTLTVSGGNATGGDVHAILYAPILSGTVGNFTQHSSVEYIGNLDYRFSLKADGGTLYMSKAPSTALATSSNLITGLETTATSSGLRAVSGNSCTSCGDTTTVFVIPDGVTRSFTFVGDVNNNAGTSNDARHTAGTKNFKITKINFGVASSALTAFFFDTSQPGLSDFDKSVFLDTADRN